MGADEGLLSMRSYQQYAQRWPEDTKDQVCDERPPLAAPANVGVSFLLSVRSDPLVLRPPSNMEPQQ